LGSAQKEDLPSVRDESGAGAMARSIGDQAEFRTAAGSLDLSKHRKESANQPMWNWRIAADALACIHAHIS